MAMRRNEPKKKARAARVEMLVGFGWSVVGWRRGWSRARAVECDWAE